MPKTYLFKKIGKVWKLFLKKPRKNKLKIGKKSKIIEYLQISL